MCSIYLEFLPKISKKMMTNDIKNCIMIIDNNGMVKYMNVIKENWKLKNENGVNLEKIKIENLKINKIIEKQIKIKKYDLISFNDVQILNKKSDKCKYTLTIPCDYTFTKYKVAIIKENENGYYIEKILDSKRYNKTLEVETNKLGKIALYGRKKMNLFFLLIPVLIMLLLLFGLSYSLVPEFKDKVTEIFMLDKPTAPVIESEENDWAQKSLVKVVKDSKTGGTGKLAYYQYCNRTDTNYEKCNWEKVNDKSVIISSEGINYVWFRGMSNKGTAGKISNMVKVMIDTSAPIVKNYDFIEVTDHSLGISLDAIDELSGIDKYIYQIDNGNFYETKDSKYIFNNLNENTIYEIKVNIYDKVGNAVQIVLNLKTLKLENQIIENEIVDKTLEMPIYEVNPSNSEWSTYKYVKITYPKNSTLNEYSIDGGTTWLKYNGPVLFTNSGSIIARSSNDENTIVAERFDVLFIDPVIPTISLNNVPTVFEYTENYKLPGYSKFGKSGGSVVCTVDGIKQSNTSTLKIGTHDITCIATSKAGAVSKVSKKIEVTYISGQDYIDGAWANLTLNYPDKSINRRWMVYDQNTVVTYDENYYQWNEYIGPIRIRVEDIEKIIIEYELDGKKLTSSYSENPYVVIQPESYKLNIGEKTKVTLAYGPNDYKVLQYRINEDGAWTNYTGTFEVGPNSLIEAKIVTTYDVFEDGKKIAEKKSASYQTAYISLISNKLSSSSSYYQASLGIDFDCPNSLNATEIGKCSIKFGSDFESVSYFIDSPTVEGSSKYLPYKENSKFDVRAGDYIYAKGQYLDENNNIQSVIKEFRIVDGTNDNIQIVPENSEPLEDETTLVRINYADLLTERKYRINGGQWKNYTSSFEAESGSLIEAIATIPGQDDKTYASKQIGQSIYKIDISVSNNNPKLGEFAKVKINYNKYMNIKKYRVNGGSWIEYNGEFNVGPDSIIEAWGKVNDHYDVYQKASVGHTDYDPSYILKGPKISFKNDANNKYISEVTITTEKPARWIKYKIGNGNYQTYEYPFSLEKGKRVCTIYQDEENGVISSETCDYDVPPQEYDYGVRPYLSYDLTPDRYVNGTKRKAEKVTVTINPGGATNLQYSYDNVVWQDYTGPFDVYENTTIYVYGTNKYGTDREVIYIDYIDDVAPTPIGNVEDIKIIANPSGKVSLSDESDNIELVSPEKTTITITWDNEATKKYYRLGTEEAWREYSESFDVYQNCTVYAYQVTPDGASSANLLIDFLEEGYAEPIINYSPDDIITTMVTVDIEFDQNAVRNTYSIDGSTFIDYTGPFDVTEKNTIVYAKSEFEDGTIKYSTAMVGGNIAQSFGRIDSNSDAYYIIYLNYPQNSYEPSRKYKYKKTGTITNYKPEGIMLIKEEKVSEVLDADGNAYIIDENGKKTLYKGDHYLLDVNISEIWENVFMTWENGEVEAPVIIVDETEQWTPSINVTITYPEEVTQKQYKIIYEDGTNTGWLQYTETLNIEDNNCIIYARGINKAGAISKETTYKVKNVDNGNPAVRYMGVSNKTINSITLEFSAVDIDGGTGISRYEYSLDGINWVKSSEPTYTFENLATNTSYTLYARAFDEAENSTGTLTLVEKTNNLDKPIFKISPSATDWSSKKTIEISYMDGNYINEYSLDYGLTWIKYENPIEITNPTVIMAKSTDGTNTSYADTLNITRIDNTKPVASIVSTTALSSRITIKANAIDNESGILKYYYSIDGKNYYSSFNDEFTINNLNRNTTYTVYTYSENMAGLTSEIVSTQQKTSEIDPPIFSRIDSYNDKQELMNSNINLDENTIDNIWSYTKKITITYPYLDEDCQYEYALINLLNPQQLEWKNAVVNQENHNSTVDILIDDENMAVIARVVSGPNVVASNTLKLDMIDRTEPTIDLSGLPKSIQVGDSYELPTNFAGDDNKSGASASCSVKENIIKNTNELRSGMQPLVCTVTTGAGHSVTIKHTLPIYPSLTFEVDSIIQGVKNANITTEGDFYFKVNSQNETIKYNVELWLYNGNTIFDDPNAKFCDDIEDKMCVIKVNGDLTIESGVNVSPQVAKKGFLIYTTGKLINKGTISMTGLGYAGEGENVYLYKSSDNVYEIVPKNGGSGADAVTANNSFSINGNTGVQTSKRQTGGGGSGAAIVSGNYTTISGAGASGTSYSGGSGGGAVVGTCNATASDAEQNALAGGLGAKCGSMNYGIGGGVGNPTANSSTTANSKISSSSGAGGLLIIYANDFENNNVISSNGIDSLSISGTNTSGSLYATGGASGGGSINIFYDKLTNKGTVLANGGKGGIASNASMTANGGNGANGRITYNTIVDEQILGSKTNPYKISTAEEFMNIKNIISDYDSAYFELVNDIDLNGYNINSIGTAENPFSANFDGKNHTISNVTISKSDIDDVGVFGLISNAVIKNLTIANADITGNNNVGILAGSLYDETTIDNVKVTGKVTGNKNVGGLVGFVSNTTNNQTIKNAITEVEIKASDDNTGGLIGKLYSTNESITLVENTGSKVTINSDANNIGGLIGNVETISNDSLKINNSYSDGKINGKDYVGGLIGKLTSKNSNVLSLDKVVSGTDLVANNYVAGLIAYISKADISNAYATGNVTSNDYAGAFTAYVEESKIENTYAIGTIDSELVTHVGGYAGVAKNTEALNSYFSSQTTKVMKTALGANLRIQKMLYKTTCYNSFDFDSVWSIEEGTTTAYINGLYIPLKTYEKNIDYINLNGEGSINNPYLIYNAIDLIEINNELDAHYKLMADIDLTGISFDPIGQEEFMFTGSLDGNNHKITGLNINKNNLKVKDNIGLFEILNGATIIDLTIENANVTGDNNVGILAGKITSSTVINNVKVSGNIESVSTDNKVLNVIPVNISNKQNSAREIATKTGTEYNDWLNYLNGVSEIQPIEIISSSVASALNLSKTTSGNALYNSTGVEIYSGRIGGLVGYIEQKTGEYNTTINNVTSNVTINSDGKRIGGSVGEVNIRSTYDKNLIINTVSSTSIINNEESGSEYVGGFVGYLNNNSIMSSTYENIYSAGEIHGLNYVGGTIGKVENKKTSQIDIMNISSSTDISSTGLYTAGSIGWLYNPSTGTINLNNVTNTGNIVSSKDYVGGIVGMSQNVSTGKIEINNISSTGDVEGSNYVGGAIGYILAQNKGLTNISNGFATGNVIATKDYAGGFIGRSSSNSTAVVNNINKCYATGNVSGETRVGGFIGFTTYSNIKDTFTTGMVSANDIVGSYVGEVSQATINNSYAIGKIITTGQTVGGFAAKATNTTAKNDYFSSQTTGYIKTAVGINVSTTNNKIYKLLKQNTYADYDFENIWAIDEDISTAYLQGLEKPDSVLSTNITYNKMVGEGTQDNPYQIATPDDLNDVRNEASAYYIVVNDIDMKDYTVDGINSMKPIGEAAAPFSGTIDGQGFTIKNYTYNSSEDNVGLFSLVTNATIKNLNIENFDISGKNYVGILVGNVSEGLVVDNVNIKTSTLTGSANYIGGLVGYINESKNINNKFNNITTDINITGAERVGGLIGYSNQSINDANLEITNTTASGNITGNKFVGGLVGYVLNSKNSSITLENNTNNYLITGSSSSTESIAGFIGHLENQNTGKITINKNTNNGNITNINANSNVNTVRTGGIVGSLNNTNNGEISLIENTNNGIITGKDNVGGAIGYLYTLSEINNINNFTNNGEITGRNNVGGAIGYIESNKALAKINIIKTSNNNSISANDSVGGIIGQILNRNTATFTMDNLISDSSEIYGNNSTGGIIGIAYNMNNGSLIINNSYAKSNINSSSNYAGGLIGQIYASNTNSTQTISIDKCYATGNITSSGSYAGGLVGSVRSNAKKHAIITKSYATGNIKSLSYAGGLIGQALYTDISDTYATGGYENSTNNNETPTNSDYIGGLVGSSQNSNITTSYATGYLIANGNLINGDTPMSDYNSYNTGLNVVSLVGYSDATVVTDSYYSSEISGIFRGVNGTSRNILEMLDKNNYNFDFIETWTIDEGISTPYLQDLERPDKVNSDNYVAKHKLSGEGTESNPYLIYNLKDFNYIRYDRNASYKLMDDINLEVDENGTKFLAIGEAKESFSGIIDGNNHKIYGGVIDTLDESVGLFGSLQNATIKNLTLENITYPDGKYAGMIAGIGYENVKIDNVHIINNQEFSGVYVGSVFGYISQIGDGETTLNNIEVKTNLKAHESTKEVVGGEVGGLVGHIYNNGINNINISNIMIDETTTINVSEVPYYNPAYSSYIDKNIGGLIGKMINEADSNVNVSNITMNGKIAGILSTTNSTHSHSYNHNIGGLIGYNVTDSSMNLNINNSNISGNINLNEITRNKVFNVSANIGGVIGYNENKATTSTSSANTIINGVKVDGLFNIDPEINDSTLAINFNHNVGGLIGKLNLAKEAKTGLENQNNLTITGSYVESDIKQGIKDTAIGKNYSGTVGGLVGYIDSYSTKKVLIEKSYTTGDIIGNDYVGGIVGRNNENNVGTNIIELVYTTGDISGNNYVGGIVGESSGVVFNTFEINKSYSIGAIKGYNYVGGIAGLTNYMELNNLFTTGTTNGNDYVASFVGNTNNTTINHSYGVGKVTSTNTIGGFVTKSQNSISNNSYFSSDSTKLFRTALGTNVRIDKMIKIDPCYEEWDFDTIWNIEKGNTLAYLKELPKPDSVNASNYDINPYSGEGTLESAYEIYTIEDLNNMRIEANKSYKLMNNLDLTGIDFVPIGEDNQMFTGTFDGQGFTISNMKVNDTGFYNGLFGVVSDATIKNLKLENVDITSTKEDTGALIGLSKGNTRIENIEITYSNITSTGSNTGGLIGKLEDSNINESVIRNINIEPVSSENAIKGNGNIGGLIGYLSNEASEEIYITDINVKNVNLEGTINKFLNIGGLIGYAKNISDESTLTIDNKINVSGNINTLDSTLTENNTSINTGGLIGQLENTYGNTTISNLTTSISVNHILEVTNSSTIRTTYNRTGGLVGYNLLNGSGNMVFDGIIVKKDVTTNQTSVGNVTRNTYTGGIIGMSEISSNGKISLTNSYTTGNVNGISYVGGAIGYIYNKSTGIHEISKVYVTGDVTAENDYVGGFIGFFNSPKDVFDLIEKSYTTATVRTNGSHVGGFAGQTIYSNILNCYSTGDVYAKDYVSSFIGSTDYSIIKNVYAIGKITSTGKFVGSITSATNLDTFINAYFSSEATGYAASKAGINVRYEKLLKQLTYDGYDFESVWTIEEETSTAYLQELPSHEVKNIEYAKLSGEGTQDNPYLIHNEIELQSISGDLNAYYELVNDITIPEGVIITPIGTEDTPFTGSFNGNGYTISNLKIDYSLEDAGLFGFVENGIIMNFNIENAIINSTNDYVGIIAGRVIGSSTVEQINITGSIESTGDYVGGLIGAIQAQDATKLNVSQINIESKVSGNNYVGGISGFASDILNGTIKVSDINVKSETKANISYAGNLFGQLSNTGVGLTTLNDIYTTGKVDAKDYAGGLIGQSSGNLSSPILIERTYADNIVTANNAYAGGLIGDALYTNLINIPVTGKVGSINYTGGIAGKMTNSSIQKAYAYVKVLDYNQNFDPIVGTLTDSTIENVYSTKNISIEETKVGTNLDFNDILLQSSYEGFDFDNTWSIVQNQTVPYLTNLGIKNSHFINEDYNSIIEADSILDFIENVNDESVYNVTVNDENYLIHTYFYDKDQNWSSNMTFGTTGDVSTSSSEYAKRMVVVKVNGDLTINEGVTVAPYYTVYGGPKGFTLYVTGKLTNNGTIDNSHGARAVGQNVYLWHNADDTYEYVPAVGASGSAANTTGGFGIGRQTGGGAGGGTAGARGSGAAGTSYSGGTGGGCWGSSGGLNGSNGGYGKTFNSIRECGGGAGNPGGGWGAANGTGGLLIVYSNEFENNGVFKSNGYSGGVGNQGNENRGGGSGGGSINIFTNQSPNINSTGTFVSEKYVSILGSVTTQGGTATFVGGTGTVNIGGIRNNQYYDLKEIIEQDNIKYEEEHSYDGDSILSILNSNDFETGYYIFKVEANDEIKYYRIHLYNYNESQIFSENQTFGDINDISKNITYSISGQNYTERNEAQNMVVVKVNGDLTVNEGVTVAPYYTQYGGPKGFMLYVTGKLTNNGIIDNSHGAYATGENVYLWHNADDTYEYVPAVGASGSAANTTGGFGIGRQTGGGAGGGTAGARGSGAAGTSYSGGTGGGCWGSSGGLNGSNGGYGKTFNSIRECGGGAGNPGGGWGAANGTGGLLIVYSNEFENNGVFKSNGYSGGVGNQGNENRGGGSGGGSINIFTNEKPIIDSFDISVDKKYTSMLGSATTQGGTATFVGGTGTINIGGIIDNQYQDLRNIIEHYNIKYDEEHSFVGDSIISILNSNNIESGLWHFKVNGEVYPVHLYNYNGNQIFNENQIFGDENDIATANDYAKNMVIVKVNGDLTINEGVTVEPYYNVYGGPKGFTLYVTGKLTNNGTIDNSHGAKAEGQNVYLWKNNSGNYEVVSATGGSGGYGVGYSTNGINGTNGISRQTGGGGSGANWNNPSYKSGSGSAGTSYSGGSGGAATQDEARVGSAQGNGGAGGASSSSATNTTGGAGNPGGVSGGSNGTGGLLIIYSNEYENNGIVSAHGYKGGSNKTYLYGSGGSSGGGSINVFCNNLIFEGSNDVLGGESVPTRSRQGGAGGTGTINIGEIHYGEYYNLEDVEDIRENKFIQIKQSNIYPKYSLYGYEEGYKFVKLLKYVTGIQNMYYSVDDGQTWNIYENEEVKIYENTIQVKGTYTDGSETKVLEYSLNEYINTKAFDSDKTTSYIIPKEESRRIDLGNELNSMTLRIYNSSEVSSNASIKLYDENGSEIKSSKIISGMTSIIIPNETSYAIIESGTTDLEIFEINVREYSLAISELNVPKMNINQVGYYNSKTISVDYPSNENYVYEYSLDEGNTWIEYTEGIKIEENISVITRVTCDGEYVSSSVYNVSKIEHPELKIDLNDVPNSIDADYEYSYSIPSNYSFENTVSEPVISCTIDDEKNLVVEKLNLGNHIIKCEISVSGVSETVEKKIEVINYQRTNDSLLEQLSRNIYMNGNTTFTVDGIVDGVIETKNYPSHTYIYSGDQVWDSKMIFGDDSDIGNDSSYANRMVIVKVNGDLTIGENGKIEPYYTKYGGPKGLLLYVTGTLTNNGIIDNSHGAKAVGENVYLWKNQDNTFEYIPAIGANGGSDYWATSGNNGYEGNSASGRQTGGGGSGAGRQWDIGAYIARGGTGTSYSGGPGSGASNSDGGYGWRCYSGAGSDDGGAGGNGAVCSGNASGYGQISIGGTGNPSGGYATYREDVTNYVEKNGTGGLLVIYADQINNNNIIQANGTSSSTSGLTNTNGRVDTGGASGGGSINIFYKNNYENNGNITATGGAGIYGQQGNMGGSGGNGSVTITQIN